MIHPARTNAAKTNAAKTTSHAANAAKAWGAPIPLWVAALAAACDKCGSLARIGDKLGYSAATVSQVINRKYAGDTAAVEAAVRAHLLAERVDCPVAGVIPATDCLENRARGFSTASPLAVRFSRTCPTCTHNQGGGT